MNCLTCNKPIPSNSASCPACAAGALPTEGALAPAPLHRARAEAPLRELPSKRRRERNWKDEVRERVDRRRQQVQTLSDAPAAPLPLFADAGEMPLADQREDSSLGASASGARGVRPGRVAAARERAPRVPQLSEAPLRPQRVTQAGPAQVQARTPATPGVAELSEPSAERQPRQSALDLSDGTLGPQVSWMGAAEAVDRVLVDQHASVQATVAPQDLTSSEQPALAPDDEAPALAAAPGPPAARLMELGPDPLGSAHPGVVSLGDDDATPARPSGAWSLRTPDDGSARVQPARRPLPLDDPSDEGWDYPAEARPAARSIERPAEPLERVQAGLVDLGVLMGLAGVVVWCAARMAKVPLEGLRPAWPFVAGYCLFLGLVYATYFTGTTGQTVGKILFSLRVVDTDGRAPGYGRALLRAALGAVATCAGGLGLASMFLDPARRALHDRLCGTRVVSPGQADARR